MLIMNSMWIDCTSQSDDSTLASLARGKLWQCPGSRTNVFAVQHGGDIAMVLSVCILVNIVFKEATKPSCRRLSQSSVIAHPLQNQQMTTRKTSPFSSCLFSSPSFVFWIYLCPSFSCPFSSPS